MGRPQEAHMLRIVRGTPSDEELAALTAVLAGVFSRGVAATPSPRRSAWAAPATRLRTPLPPGPGAWRASALPR
ncbi:MAG: acyl-CoA carboxylase subunit epsilon [Actinobacteria bacterium]|nr:acyl-CoA carboxylase subunit epsilon [Actinomycetota bacterium]